ncbi:ABC transporter permease [Oceanobacillus alkalisoli]|uniref:ABC transporter permease n=1 Tax=Oceanobacillus alkalisoli TaxID=2925113 RepID=UPI001EE43BDA|nr:ABC transporter permease [Oceanobacillus alkalisoli]
MTFRQFAFNNVLRNKRIYAAYFLSSLFSVMVFFVYGIFAFHPALKEVHPSVTVGLHFAEGIIYVFSFIFVLVSMSAFLHSRKKEFGLMVMLGMTNKQLRKMVFLENVLIGSIATISGVGIGLVFAKIILMTAESVLELKESLPFYMPWEAIILTCGAFLLLFVVISFFTVFILKGNKLIDLIKGSAVPKKEPKASVVLSLLAAVLLAVGYGVALTVKGDKVVFAMIPVTVIVIIGTYFLFTQLSVFIINRLKKRKGLFWKKTNLVLFSDLAHRMKDNARTFFFVAIVSTVAFTAIGTLVGFRFMLTNSLAEERPFAIEYSSSFENEQEGEHIQLIEEKLDGLSYQKLPVHIKNVSIPSLATEYVPLTGVISESEFNAIAEAGGRSEEQVALDGQEAAYLYYHSTMMEAEDIEEVRTIDFAGKEINQKTAFGSVLMRTFDDYLIVDDAFYDAIMDFEQETFYVFQVDDWKATADMGEQLLEDLGVSDTNGYGEHFTFSNLGYDWYVINQSFGTVLFIGLFIGVVFFVAAGSFLYFRLYADIENEQQKFAMISKIGLTDKELSKVLTTQLALLFFIPIITAVIHGAVALTALKNMFNYSMLESSVLVLGSFTLIQIIYFIFIRHNYIRRIKSYITN